MRNIDELPMRIAVGQINELTDQIVQFAKQLGIEGIQFSMFRGSSHLPGETHWEYMDLLRLRTRCEEAGLRLDAIENVPSKVPRTTNDAGWTSRSRAYATGQMSVMPDLLNGGLLD